MVENQQQPMLDSRQSTENVRLWVYRSVPKLTDNQKSIIQRSGDAFCESWKAHGQPLKAEFKILNDHYLVFFVDQSWAQNSGCSIDASVKWVRQIESEFNLGLFDRMKIGFEKNGEIVFYDYNNLKEHYENGDISDDTPVVNHLLDNASDFRYRWKVPFLNSPFYMAIDKSNF